MSSRLKDRIAIVVGAGSAGREISNGGACAVAFAREGAKVLCVDKSLDAARETVDRIAAVAGVAEAYQADVRNAKQMNGMVARCLESFGRVDILHYNVGIEEFGELTDLSEESWDRVHAVNLKGAMLASREVVPHMIRQGGGSIINISSTASKKWTPWQLLSYSTSKAAMNQMTRFIARQYASYQVRCNVILPGMIDTPNAASLYPTAEAAAQGREDRAARCPMGRQGTPWVVAGAAVFLASDDSRYVTGLELVVDGGLSLG